MTKDEYDKLNIDLLDLVEVHNKYENYIRVSYGFITHYINESGVLYLEMREPMIFTHNLRNGTQYSIRDIAHLSNVIEIKIIAKKYREKYL